MSFPRAEYYCLSETGETDVTENPKAAMRYLTQEGAEQQADRLGWCWIAVTVKFPSDEKAY
jgi:hypothetical protein